MTAAIEIRHLTKRFGDRLAVDDLSFAVEPGNVTGFVGPMAGLGVVWVWALPALGLATFLVARRDA